MTTTRYLEFLTAYNADKTIINNINWAVRLLYESYIPNENHTFLGNQTKDAEIISGGSLNGTEFKNNSMSVIIDLMKVSIKNNIAGKEAQMINKINDFNPLLMTTERKESLRNLIYQTENADANMWWQRLKDNGMKYFVIQSTSKKILIWCEDIE